MFSPLKLFWFAFFMLTLIAGCQKQTGDYSNKATMQLHLTHEVDGMPLQTGVTYNNTFGEAFTVSRFKYYLSNIALVNGNEIISLPANYFLVDHAIDTTQTISMNVKPGTYTGLRLLVGVDSARNVSGAQTGALDPVLDMFWTWNTGYIMAKLEGNAPNATTPNNRIQYHIGGYSGPHSTLRTLQINFPAPVKVNRDFKVDLIVELLRWFDGSHSLPIVQEAVSMSPGALSARYADNYIKMFRLNSVLIP